MPPVNPASNPAALRILLLLAILSVPTLAGCQVLNADYTLSGNETALATCFTLATDNITLDCNGYSINVTGATVFPSVDVNARNTTIRNCMVRDTNTTNVAMGAIRLTLNANQTTILNTNISTIGRYALYVLSGANNFTNVNATTTTQGSYGSYFLSSSNNYIKDSIFTKTATGSSYVIYWYNGDQNTFDNVTVNGSSPAAAKYGAYLYGFTNGAITGGNYRSYNLQALWFQGGSNFNTLRNITVNTSNTNAAHGIVFDTSTNNNVFDSTLNGTGVNIYIQNSAGYNWLENLTLNSTASSGIYAQSTLGVSDYNTINNVTAVALNYPVSFFQSSSNNNVTNSTLNSTANHAFYASGATTGNLFMSNTFTSRLSGGAANAVHFAASSSSNNIFRNNTIYSPTSYGIKYPHPEGPAAVAAGFRLRAKVGFLVGG